MAVLVGVEPAALLGPAAGIHGADVVLRRRGLAGLGGGCAASRLLDWRAAR